MMDEDFPRGGASVLTPIELRQIHAEAEREVSKMTVSQLKRQRNEVPAKRAKKSRLPTKKKSKHPLASDEDELAVATTDDGQRMPVPLTFRQLAVGMKCLGVIKDVTELDLVVSLPNQLTGYVSITDISDLLRNRIEQMMDDGEKEAHVHSDPEDGSSTVNGHASTKDTEALPPLRDLFHTGQRVLCTISALDDNQQHAHAGRRIALSLHPTVCQQGLTLADLVPHTFVSATVLSIEDHGYRMDLGMTHLQTPLHGFLTPAILTPDTPRLPVGHTLTCIVTRTPTDPHRSIVSLSHAPHDLSKLTVVNHHESESSSVQRFESLAPGMLLNATVQSVHDQAGLVCLVLGVFRATIDLFHCGTPSASSLSSLFRVGQKVRARLLYVDAASKRLGLSLLADWVSWREEALTSLFSMGQIIDNAVILRVDPRWGLLLSLHENSNHHQLGYVHLSRLQDMPEGSRAPRSIDTARYRSGGTVRCRLLSLHPCDGVWQCTMQASVLSLPFLRYEDVRVGELVRGTVLAVSEAGLTVSLTEHLRGLCPRLHLADTMLKHPQHRFQRGTVLSFRVLECDPQRHRLLLTHKKTLLNSPLPRLLDQKDCVPDVQSHGVITAVRPYGLLVTFYGNLHGLVPASDIGGESSLQEDFSVGQVVKCRVVQCTRSDRLRLSLRSAQTLVGARLRARILARHSDTVAVRLLDHPDQSAEMPTEWAPRFEDDVVVRVLRRSTHNNSWWVTAVPSLIDADMSASMSELEEAQRDQRVLTGYVDRLLARGAARISFLGHVGGRLQGGHPSALARYETVQVTVSEAATGRLSLLSSLSFLRASDEQHLRKRQGITVGDVLQVEKEAASSRWITTEGHCPIQWLDTETVSIRSPCRVTVVDTMQDHVVVVLTTQHSETETLRVTVSHVRGTDVVVKEEGSEAVGILFIGAARLSMVRVGAVLQVTRQPGRPACFILSDVQWRALQRRTASSTTAVHLPVDAVPTVQTLEDVHEDGLVDGWVTGVSTKGLFLALSSTLSARCQLSQLSDGYIREDALAARFPTGMHVTARVISVDRALGRIECALKESVVAPEKAPYTLATLPAGEDSGIRTGRVRKIMSFGVFVLLDRSVGLSGLVHVSEVPGMQGVAAAEVLATLQERLAVDDPVRVTVLRVDLKRKRISLRLLPYEGEGEGEREGEEGENEEDNEENENEWISSDEEVLDDEILDEESLPVKNKKVVSASMLVDVDTAMDFDDEEKDDLSSRMPLLVAKQPTTIIPVKAMTEEEIRARERAMAEGRPEDTQTAEDFERQLLSQPTQSLLWIQYMAFQLSLADVDKARSVAERALSTLPARDEVEKFNVWLAYLNLENAYGGAERLETLFKRALQYLTERDKKRLHLQLVKMLERTGNEAAARLWWPRILAKYRASHKVWLAAMTSARQRAQGMREVRQTLMPQALQALPKRKHTKLVAQMAQMEFKFGEAERGRTLFEGLMTNEAKRVDLWSVYLDMEIREQQQAVIRRLFDRVIHMTWNARKMKFFFKKYLAYEKRYGDDKSVLHVKELARAYVEQRQVADS